MDCFWDNIKLVDWKHEVWQCNLNIKLKFPMARLRVGQTRLNHHLFKMRLSDSPNCPHCLVVPETIEHFLMECPRFHSLRVVMVDSVRALGVDDVQMHVLLGGGDLSEEKKIKINKFLARFIGLSKKEI